MRRSAKERSACVAVFDAGIGSYAIARMIRERAPAQDVVYLADRASFPYGAKSRDELLAAVRRAIAFLEGFAPSAIVLASNAPSITVLDDLRASCATPIHGVTPPIAEALALSRSERVAVLGVRSLVISPEMRAYARLHGATAREIALIDASPLVELVETGAFLHDEPGTQIRVEAFLDDALRAHPATDVFTLSSTHLPWLRAFFERAAPGLRFLDPAASLVASLPLRRGPGAGATRCLATFSDAYPLAAFQAMLARLGVDAVAEAARL